MTRIPLGTLLLLTFLSSGVFWPLAASATTHGQSGAPSPSHMPMSDEGMMGEGMLRMPSMDPARGRKLFASKGCVVCHAVNGIGGEHALPMDAATMEPLMNPFEFAAKMWRGAEAMIFLQREELGEQIEFTGEELADIIAFVHHPEEQERFSEADIPERIKGLMHHLEEDAEPHHGEEATGSGHGHQGQDEKHGQ